jgi:putative two-component system response regulator
MSSAGVAHRVLIVDDSPAIAELLAQALRFEGYQVAIAEDGLAALAQVAAHRPDLILLDLDLPGLTGDAVCRQLKADPATRLIPVVMVTAQGAMQSRLDACNYGADDFLAKPFHLIEVTTRCRSLLRIKRLIEERDSAEAVVFALARAVEAKSPYTHGHSERVMHYALVLADTVGVGAAERELLGKGALLHDIGKISIPDAILDKPGRLTPAEFEVIKDHTVQGAHIVEPLISMREAVPLIRWHHERLDGGGYPDGLAGDAIPPLVRILSVADVYDSLSSDRPYRGPIPHGQCLQMLRDNALSGGLDPELVAAFCTVVVPLQAPSGQTDSAALASSGVSLPLPALPPLGSLKRGSRPTSDSQLVEPFLSRNGPEAPARRPSK